tara:strand:- start:771 stop:1790 length:1020 start_codon:yes stop_codon:yes gene_type:complete
MQTIKTLLIFILSSTFVLAQGEAVELFQSEDVIPLQISYSNRSLKKSDNDTIFFDTSMKFQTPDGVWNDIKVGVRARGNFRRSTCYFPPIKMKIKKSDAKGTIFKGNKKLKLVLPCKLEKNKNDNILRELIAYKLYEVISPYHFKTRRVSIDFEEIKRKKTEKFVLNGFLIEDDKNVSKRLEFRNWDRFMHPLNMIPEASVQNNFFQFMIGNTDFSTAYSHNGKLLVNKENKFIPVPYDFDMSGIVDPSYAVSNEVLGLKSIQERKYRGFKRDESVVYLVRDQFLYNKDKLINIINGFKADFDNPNSHQEVVDYINSFFEIIEDDKRFKSDIIAQMRTK